MEQYLDLQLSTQLTELKRLRSELHGGMQAADVDGQAEQDIALAAVEAVTNAIRHPIERASDTIRVPGSISNNTVALMIDDDGSWRAPERNEDCGDCGGYGYGLALMKALMTDIRIERRSAGTRVSLRRQLR